MNIDEPPAETLSLGPTGKSGKSNRAKMYAHNRKVAARQQEIRQQVEQGALPASALSELTPLGPMGKGFKSQRAKMYAHNRRIAAWLQKGVQGDPQEG